MILLALTLSFVQLTTGATLPEAVGRATADAEALTQEYEAGGAVYQCGNVLAYSVPETQHKRDRVAIQVATFADTCALVALYHTHPKGDARFSRDDIAMACRNNVPSYILPHGGKLRVFDCRQLPLTVRESAWQNPFLSAGKEA
jgi:proteasome lid subunit RPN8/RPN11